MPRIKKNVIGNRNVNISLHNLKMQDISDNDCLSAELYISGLDERMCHIIENFYRLTLIGEVKSINIEFKNSWKGLIQFLLSFLYCKKGGKIIILQAQYKFVHGIRMDHEFELLESANFPNNPPIEKLYIPTSFRPIYVRSNYTNKTIYNDLLPICHALGMDTKKSKLGVEATKTRNYEGKPIERKIDIKNLICGIFSCTTNEGITIITNDTMKSLMDKYWILVAHPLNTPQQMKRYNEDEWDCTYPYKFLAYPVLKRYEEQLIKYFPLQKDSIKYYAQKTDKFEYAISTDRSFIELGCDYIITDFVEMGKWG